MSVVFSFDIKDLFRTSSKRISQGGDGFYLDGDNGSTVILIHGLTGTPNEMKYLAGFLHKKGYSVICPRLANHGEPIRILKNTKWQSFYESVRDALVKGQAASGAGPVFAAGLSMGALLALLLADEFKDKIRGVSCLAPTLFYDGWNVPNSKYLLPLGYYTFLKHFYYFKEEPPYGIKNETIRERVHRYYDKAKLDDMENVAQYGYPYFPITLFHQLRLLVNHITRRLPDIRCPVQLIQAKDDDMTSVKNSKFIYDRVSSGMKEMVLLYDSYHVITADHERDIVAQKMDLFFNRIRTDPASLKTPPAAAGKAALTTRVVRRIDQIPQDEWDRVYPNILEGYQFFKSIDESDFEGFSFYYILVYKGRVPVGAAPCFLMNYSLDTSIKGRLRHLSNFIKSFIPNIFSIKTLVCGVPIAEGAIGIAGGETDRVIEAIYGCMEKLAKDEKAPVIAFKDFGSHYTDILDPLLKKGFSMLDSLPTTEMAIRFTDFEEYLETLGSESRYGLRRKFKKVDANVKIEMEATNTLKDDVLAEAYGLYLQTIERHELRFEITPMEFLKNISRNMPGQAKFFLWRIDKKLVAFTFALVSEDFFSDYYLGFDYSVAHKYHLYFVRFRDLINWCIRNNIKRYDMGVTSYEPKKRLGFNFVPLYIYAQYRNELLRPLFNILCRFLKFENFDPVLKEIKK